MRRLPLCFVPLLALLAACSRGESRPRAWGAPRLASDDACPQVIGRYLLDESPVPWVLALRFVPLDDPAREPESFAIADQTDRSLLITVRYTDGSDETRTLRRGSEYGGDYRCEDGWVRLGDGQVAGRWDDQLRLRDEAPKRRSLRFAPAPDGAIIARLDGLWFEGFQPYAPGSGDGIPLPWTIRRAHAWSRTEAFSDAALTRQRQLGSPTEQARRTALARAQLDPVYLENEALENPPPTASQVSAQARIRRTVAEGVQVAAVSPRDSGWHVSVNARDSVVVARFVSLLVESGDVLEARHESIYRGTSPEGTLATVVYVRLKASR